MERFATPRHSDKGVAHAPFGGCLDGWPGGQNIWMPKKAKSQAISLPKASWTFGSEMLSATYP
jgi:hypothetical protein